MRQIVKVYSAMSNLENRKTSLDDIQRPIYDICIKMIGDRRTDLRSMKGDYQLENDEYFVSIRYSSSTPVISLFESRDQCSNVHTVFMDNEYTESIIDTFDREMSRRMRYRDSSKRKEIADHLSRIVSRFENHNKKVEEYAH